MAGIFEVPFTTFLAYNIPGIIIGVGQFIVVGYFFGNKYELVLWIVERYMLLFFVLAILVIGLYWYMKKSRKEKTGTSH